MDKNFHLSYSSLLFVDCFSSTLSSNTNNTLLDSFFHNLSLMSTKESTIQLLSTEDELKSYKIEPNQEEYENWSVDKVHRTKNTLLKFVYDEIKTVVKPRIGSICDGKNVGFCLIHRRNG
ncbi:unnamed protein product, partial [Tuber aestivum]